MDPTPSSLAVQVVDTLTRAGRTVAVAESLTGGLVTAEIVNAPGASAVLRGGIVAYASELKSQLLGVDAMLLGERGAVDAEVAKQMAAGVRERLGVLDEPASIGVSTTGVAGPEPQDGHEHGEVWIGIATERRRDAYRYRFSGDRDEVRRETVRTALELVLAAATE